MVCTILAAPSRTARRRGLRLEAMATGRLMPSPMASAVRLTSTWLPRYSGNRDHASARRASKVIGGENGTQGYGAELGNSRRAGGMSFVNIRKIVPAVTQQLAMTVRLQ